MNRFSKFPSKEVGVLAVVFAVWRVVLFGWSMVAGKFMPYEPSFPYAFTVLNTFGLPQWLYSWANFDGVHYLTIAQRGYEAADLIQAFFPLYPLFMRYGSWLIGNELIVGLIIANAAFVGCLLMLYKMVRAEFDASIAFRSVAVMLFFPTSFFFGAVYSESLFLLIVLLSFYFAEKRQWLIVGLFIAAATATRIVGVFLIPAVMLELYRQNKQHRQFSFSSLGLFLSKHWRNVLIVSLGFLGIGGYMLYLYLNYNDPLYFWHVQSEFGSGREEGIVLLPQVMWRYFKILATVPLGREWLIYLQEFIFGLVPLGLILYYWLKKHLIKASWAVFSLAALLLPTLTGNFSSMPRYVLVAFPLYIIVSSWLKNRIISGFVLTVSGILLLLNLLLFIQGYWVA